MYWKSRDSPTRLANFTGKSSIGVVKFYNHCMVQAVMEYASNVRLSHHLMSLFYNVNVKTAGLYWPCTAVKFFSSSVTYPAMGMSPLLPECYGTIDNPGNVTKSPELV